MMNVDSRHGPRHPLPPTTPSRANVASRLPPAVAFSAQSETNDWKPELFPFKMYDLLEDAEQEGFDDIASWMSSGKAFKIHNRFLFEKKIMPRYFPNMNSYKSFRRQLNFYGIYQDRNIQHCPDNSYAHELFVRGQRHLCEFMERKKQSLQQAAPAIASKRRESDKSANRGSSTTCQSGMATPCFLDRDPSFFDHEWGENFTFPEASDTFASLGEHHTLPSVVLPPPPATPLTSYSGNVQEGDTFQLFLMQEWSGLPEDVTCFDVIDEIVSTFSAEKSE